MKTKDFSYDLPQELIAQHPAQPRDSSRMMVVSRETGEIKHCSFCDIVNYLSDRDCLILNDTRVLPARLYGVKDKTLARVEFLLLKRLDADVWECAAGPARRAKEGSTFTFNDGVLRCKIEKVLENGNRAIRFDYDGSDFFSVLDKVGQMPLPHYIKEKLEDSERYQTVYSKELGSAAAPTAGLHFTKELLQKIEAKGVKTGYVTLHVGLGTFRPVKVQDIEEHKMHAEHYCLPKETAALINETKCGGGRIIAVGTTCCRTLEASARKNGGVICADEGFTDIFIYPGYEFACIDGLLTNFHLPESTLLMLVSAFLGYDKTMNAYKEAIKERYRFFSFGDCELIL